MQDPIRDTLGARRSTFSVMALNPILKVAGGIHRAVLKLSGGRFGSTMGGMPVLELVTTGRKSGQPHSLLLTAPVRDGDTLVIVASRGGDDHHPHWYLNLEANPEVTVSLDGETTAMIARIADAEKRAELWPKVVAASDNYRKYQEKTDREIPLVLLDPAG